jgi:hypothetical protein
MKKILLGTSALAMAGAVAGQANAATWDLDWGGYFEASVGYASVDGPAGTDYDGVDVLQDAEIQFTPSITLDNGLTFGVDVQLEANASSNGTGDVIDESFVFVKGSFGQILIGSENSAGYKMSYGAPDVTWIGVNSGSLTSFIPNGMSSVFRGVGGSSFIEVGRNNDAQRITYFTPRFSGFQLGASYARDANQDTSCANDNNGVGAGIGCSTAGRNTALHDIFDIGANYVNSFGAFDIALSGRYGTASSSTPGIDPEVYAVGLNLGYAGFKIGGSFASSDDDVAVRNGEFFDVGVSYTTGPWGTSFTYSKGDLDTNQERDQYLAGVTYKLGPGVSAGAYAGFLDYDAPGTANDVDGFVIGTGFKLSF